MADLDIAALRKRIANYGAVDWPSMSLPIGDVRRLLDAAEQSSLADLEMREQLQAVKAERDELQRIDAVRLDQIKTLQDIIRRDLTPAGIEVEQWRAERDQLRAQRDALLADTEGYLEVFRRTDMQRMVSDEMKNPELAAQRQRLQDNVRNCKETNQ